jgi:hypothetical protein
VTAVFGSTATVHYLDGSIDGPRVVTSRASPLRVFACSWSDISSLMSGNLPPNPGMYLLTKPVLTATAKLAVRPGEALDVRRRLGEHALDPSKSSFAEVFAVVSVDDRLSKTDCRYLEARAHEIVAAAPGCVLEVEKIPAVSTCPPHERDVLESLLVQARIMLHAAGCRALDAPNLFLTADAERDEGVIEIQSDLTGNPEDEHELSYDGIWSRGYPTADGGFIIRAGSDIRRRENGALLPAISNRRRMLETKGVLGSMPGVSDRWRLLSNVHCSSALLAAKVCTGAHVSNKHIWQRIAPASRIILAN